MPPQSGIEKPIYTSANVDSPTISPRQEKDDPVSGTYDFGPRIGKVTNLKIGGQVATRDQALQYIQQYAKSIGGTRDPLTEGGATDSTPNPQSGGGTEQDEMIRNFMKDLAPMALFPYLGKMGFARGSLAAGGAGAAGGQIGEWMDTAGGASKPSSTFTDWLSRRGEDAAFGAGSELGGRALGGATRLAMKPVKGLLGGSMGTVPETLRESVAKKYDIHFTPSQVMDEYSQTTGQPKGLLMRGEESRAFHNPYSRSIAQSGARVRGQAARSTVAGLTAQLGPEVPSNITGKRIANAIESVGKPTWQRQVEHLKSIVNAKAHGTQVDVTSLRDEAERELQEMAHQQHSLGVVDEEGNPILPTDANVKLLREISNFPDNMPFSALAKKRSDWMGVSPQITELISGKAKGTAKYFTQLSTTLLDEAAKSGGRATTPAGPAEFLKTAVIDEYAIHGVLGVPTTYSTEDLVAKGLIKKAYVKGVEGKLQFTLTPAGVDSALFNEAKTKWTAAHPGEPPNFSAITAEAQKLKTPPALAARAGFEQDWNRFRNFTRKGADVFESQVITDAVNKNPEDVVKLIKGDNITDMLRVRRAIKDYAEMYGTTHDKIKSAAAWRKFQTTYLRENVLGPLDGNMNNLSDALDKMTPAMKRAIFDDPQAKSTLLRLTQVGKALKDADKNLGVLMGHQDPLSDLDTRKGWVRSLRPYIVSRIAWNPTATRFFLRGLGGLAESAPTDSAIKDFVTQTLVGKGSKSALKAGGFMTNRRLGAAMADIIRAYDMANIYDEAKQNEHRADEYLKQVQQPKPEGSTGVPEPQPQ